MTGIVLALFIIITALRVANIIKERPRVNRIRIEPRKAGYSRTDAVNFVKRLEELGYFKYAAPSDVEPLKRDLIDYYSPDGDLPSINDEETDTPKDYRGYLCDGEEVYEEGGIIKLLKELQPTFDKLGFQCEITDHFEEWDCENDWLNHRITINGTEYVLFKNFTGIGWGEALARIAKILNRELEKQGKDERIYLAMGGNDSCCIFLTEELYRYIYSIYKNPYYKPLEPCEWEKVMGAKPMHYD